MHVTVNRPLLKSLLVLAAVVEARDPFTGGHVWRTSRYARDLAASLGLDTAHQFLAQVGGLVHDLGKVAIPDEILNKRGRITPEEYEVVKHHPVVGYELLVNHPLALLVIGPVMEHHLRMDGAGYPDSHKHIEPSLISRVVTVADAFDAMTSHRPYRSAATVDHALTVLDEETDRQFDGKVVSAFRGLVESGRVDHIIGHSCDARLMLNCPDCGPIVAPPKSADDGDAIDCPACTNEFVMHVSADTFELQWKGTKSRIQLIHPDYDSVDEIVDAAPDDIHVDL